MDLDKLTLGDVKQLRCLLGGAADGSCAKRLPMPIGKVVFIRTVTYHMIGEVLEFTDEEVALGKAAWVADDGRFHEAMATGKFNEVEPYPDDARVVVNRGSVIDWVAVPFAAPRSVK